MKHFKEFIHALLCLSFSIIVGAGLYEHLALWPNAYSAPPKSLSMFQGDYGINAGAFWQMIHPITLLLFIITLIVFWKTRRRKYILYPFLGYIIVLVITAFYFVPELIDINTTTYDTSVDPELLQRASLWETLSIVRLISMAILAIILSLGLTKSNTRSL